MKVLVSVLAASFILAVVSPAVSAELKPGDQAPNFSLKASDGKTYNLKDYLGKKVVVLAWYPKSFTPGCTQENKSLSAKDSPLRGLDVVYFSASTDDEATQKRFAESLGANYPILSDADGKVAHAYGVVSDQRKVPERWTFVIGTDGKILDIDKNVSCPTHASDVAKKLATLKVAKKKSAE